MASFIGIMLPFIGTALGAFGVFFMRSSLGEGVQRALSCFAAGVMTAACVWSLLIPSVEQSASMGYFAFVPAVVGFWAGTIFLLLIDRAVLGLNKTSIAFHRTAMLVFSVTLHNIPEGMAVGAAWAGHLMGGSTISAMEALALSIGIAVQNIPEGAIISMPVRANGKSVPKAFGAGVLSGVVEPISAVITLLAAGFILPLLPYLLSFAAGTMMYVVVEELLPEPTAVQPQGSLTRPISFALGFSVMMMLDVMLG